MAAYGLYTHIQSNKRRSVALLIGLFFLVYVLVFAGALLAEALTRDAPLDYLIRAAEYDFLKAVPFATIGTIIWVLIAYKFHQSMIDAVTGATEVTRAEQPRLYNLLENLCISRGIPTPKLRIADDDALNAFATGLNEKQYSITVTRGLINALNDAELESVLGHELTHIRNGDVRMLVIALVIAGVISFFGEMIFRLFFPGSVLWQTVVVVEQQRQKGRRRPRHRDRPGTYCRCVDSLHRHPLRAVAPARIPRRFRLGRTHQESGRHDLGAAQNRKPRRIACRQFRRNGNVHRQSAHRIFQYFRHPPAGRQARRGLGEIRRRPRSRPAHASGTGRARTNRQRADGRRSLGWRRAGHSRGGPLGPEKRVNATQFMI